MRAFVHVLRKILPFVAGLALAAPATAQTSAASAAELHGHFVMYVAPATSGSSSRQLVHVGGGGEADVTPHLGIGTDVGGIPNARPAGRLTILSANAYYHAFSHGQSRLDPYLTAGLSGFFSESRQKTGGPNVGAGLNIWFRGHVGATIELRRTTGVAMRELRVGMVVWQ